MKRFFLSNPGAVYPILILLLAVVLWLPRLRGPLDLRYDAGVYYILGSALEQGKGYRLLNEPGEIQAIQYPPLLPLFAAMHQRFAGTSDPAVAGHWLRISFFLIFLIFVAAVYRLSSHFLATGAAFLATLVVILQVHTIWMSELFFAELPFALTSVLFIMVALRSRNCAGNWLAALLGAVCFLLRSAGIALLVAWVGESLLKRRFREMAFRAFLALIPVLAWQGYIAQVKSSPQYQQTSYEYQRAGYQFYNVGYLQNLMYVDSFVPELGFASPWLLLKRIAHNLIRTPSAMVGAVSAYPDWVRAKLKRILKQPGMLRLALAAAEVALAALGALVLFGLVIVARRGGWLIILYIAGSVGLICLTPWPGQLIRYLWPTTPFLAIAFLAALMAVRDYPRVQKGRRKAFAVAFIAAVFIGVFAIKLYAISRSYQLSNPASYKTESGKQRQYRMFYYTPAWQLHDAALDWLGSEANSDEIVATTTPHWVYLKAGLKAVMPPFEADVASAQRLIDSVPVNYLIVDRLAFVDISQRYAAPIVQAFPECWELIYSSGKRGSQIYRRVNSLNDTISIKVSGGSVQVSANR